MQGTVTKYRIALKRKQRKWLQGVVKRRTPSHWLVIRAKVILMRWSAGRFPWIGKSSGAGANDSSRVECTRWETDGVPVALS